MVDNLTLKNVKNLLAQGKRLDGRGLNDIRPLSIETGIIETAEGSARIKLGDTDVLVGIKMGVGTPFGDTPTDGVLMTGTELIPTAHKSFEFGPPKPHSIEIARLVDRCIRESGMIDVSKLCIEPGEKVWKVFVDAYPMNYDGNLFDAVSIGAAAALKTAKMPKLEDGKVVREAWEGKLPVTCTPINSTFAKIGDKIVLDPTFIEMELMDCRLTIGIKEGNVVSMQKGGFGSFSDEEVVEMSRVAVENTKNIIKKHKI